MCIRDSSDGVSKSQAGALGISGNNVNIDSSYFANNTVEGDACLLYTSH